MRGTSVFFGFSLTGFSTGFVSTAWALPVPVAMPSLPIGEVCAGTGVGAAVCAIGAGGTEVGAAASFCPQEASRMADTATVQILVAWDIGEGVTVGVS